MDGALHEPRIIVAVHHVVVGVRLGVAIHAVHVRVVIVHADVEHPASLLAAHHRGNGIIRRHGAVAQFRVLARHLLHGTPVLLHHEALHLCRHSHVGALPRRQPDGEHGGQHGSQQLAGMCLHFRLLTLPRPGEGISAERTDDRRQNNQHQHAQCRDAHEPACLVLEIEVETYEGYPAGEDDGWHILQQSPPALQPQAIAQQMGADSQQQCRQQTAHGGPSERLQQHQSYLPKLAPGSSALIIHQCTVGRPERVFAGNAQHGSIPPCCPRPDGNQQHGKG